MVQSAQDRKKIQKVIVKCKLRIAGLVLVLIFVGLSASAAFVIYLGDKSESFWEPLQALVSPTVTRPFGGDDKLASNLSEPATFARQGQVAATGTFGYGSIGAFSDCCDQNNVGGTRFTMGSTSGTVTSMSVYVGNVGAAGSKSYAVVIYNDNAGVPGTKVTNSASGTLVANSWNTIAVTPATLNANASYWLMYTTNGTNNNLNNPKLDSIGGTNNFRYFALTWGTAFPATAPAGTPQSNTTYSIYATYTYTPVPTVTTSAATSITTTTATLNGSANPNGAATTGWFRYSSTNPGANCNDTFGTRAPLSGGTSLGSGSAAVSYSRSLTGLTTGTLYYYCAIASNASGSAFGSVMSFTTLAAPVVTLTASPNPVAYNTASTLTWTISGSPTGCTNTLNMPAGNWSTMNNGTASTGALTVDKTYTLTCTNAGGSTSASVTVTVSPANPSALSAVAGCSAGAPTVTFTFTDNSTTEDLFWLDVNGAAWTSATLPSPWGVKTINRSAAEKSGTGLVTPSFVWSAANTMDTTVGSDVDPGTAGDQVVPANSKTYYWRVKAHSNTTGDSSHIYPANSTTVPGTAVTTLNCVNISYDLSASIVPGSWRNNAGVVTQTFELGSNATLRVEVRNNSLTASAPTRFYFFYNGAGLPVCPGSGVAVPPRDGNNVNQEYAVGSIPAGGTAEVPVSFAVGPVETSATAYAYVVPSCSFLPSPGVDPDFSNNRSGGFTYSVSVDKFFETVGGDIGAAANISVGFRSADIPSPDMKYQSDYIIVAQSIDSKVTSRNSKILGNYIKPQVPGGGIYDYFYTRLMEKAPPENCGMSVGIKLCRATERVLSNIDIFPSGNLVMIVDGNLRIADNVVLPDAQSTATFIVSGNITVELDVTRVDGVYIAKKGFFDSDIPSAGVGPSGALTINGGLYVDCEEGGIVSMARYFTSPINNIYPSNVFKYEPKYLLTLQSLIGVSPIVWREVEP